jgi:hypothetical protein
MDRHDLHLALETDGTWRFGKTAATVAQLPAPPIGKMECRTDEVFFSYSSRYAIDFKIVR